MSFWRSIIAYAWERAGKHLIGYRPQHPVLFPPSVLKFVCAGCALVGFSSACFFNALNHFMAPTAPSTPLTYVSPPLPCIYLDVQSTEAWIELGQERKKLPSLETMSPLTNVKFTWSPHAKVLAAYTPRSVALWRWSDISWKLTEVEEGEIHKTFFMHGRDPTSLYIWYANPAKGVLLDLSLDLEMTDDFQGEQVIDNYPIEVVFHYPSAWVKRLKFSLVVAATLAVGAIAGVVLTRKLKKRLTMEQKVEPSIESSNKDGAKL